MRDGYDPGEGPSRNHHVVVGGDSCSPPPNQGWYNGGDSRTPPVLYTIFTTLARVDFLILLWRLRGCVLAFQTHTHGVGVCKLWERHAVRRAGPAEELAARPAMMPPQQHPEAPRTRVACFALGVPDPPWPHGT